MSLIILVTHSLAKKENKKFLVTKRGKDKTGREYKFTYILGEKEGDLSEMASATPIMYSGEVYLGVYNFEEHYIKHEGKSFELLEFIKT